MQSSDENVSWSKVGTSLNFSASIPMNGCEQYFPEPLGITRIVLVVTVTAENEFRVIFNNKPNLSRKTGKEVLCFVVGQDGNSRTTVRVGNPGVVLTETKDRRALLQDEKGKERSFWFSYDASIRVAAFGLGNRPGLDSTLLIVPDWYGCFDSPTPQIFVGLANWQEPICLTLPRWHSSSLNLNQYPDKFNDDRTVKPFPGVTSICWINEKSHGSFVVQALMQAQQILKATGPTISGCFSFLPPDSFHMTITNLVTTKNRHILCPEIEGDMRNVGEELRNRSKNLMNMAVSNVFYMKINSVSIRNGLTIWLKPYETKTAKAMTAWRDLMYTSLGFTYSNNFEFHITLAYRVLPIHEPNINRKLVAIQEAIYNMLTASGQFLILPVGPPELCTFEDMSKYHKI